MKRVAFTIILNGINHLKHKNYYETMCNNFDLWVIVEGVAKNSGSTAWCNELSNNMHSNFLSNDGTTEFLNSIQSQKIIVIRTSTGKAWDNKDFQVNAAINEIKKHYSECFLWQVDIDEQWSIEDLIKSEEKLIEHGGKTGCFYSDYFVGVNQQVYGEWGENIDNPYRRLWCWQGESFKSHEPPILEGKNGPGLLLSSRFKHYSYYFEDDVKFKEQYYGGYNGLTDRWYKIQQNRGIIHVRELLGTNIHWSFTNSIIKYIHGS